MENKEDGGKAHGVKKKIIIILLVRYMQILDLKIVPALDFYLYI